MAATPFLSGLGLDVDQIIHRRLTLICSFLEHHLNLPQPVLTLEDQERQQLNHDFIHLEQQVACTTSNHWHERSNGRIRWEREYLLPLAQQLELIAQAESMALQTCWRRGWFDRRPLKQQKQKLDPEPIFREVRDILRYSEIRVQRRNELIKHRLCRDEETAQQIALELEKIPDSAAALARGLILNFLGYGPIGLLHHSSFSWTTEVLYLEKQLLQIPNAIHSHETQAILRRDVVAVSSVLTHFSLWNQNLLHDPPGTPRRTKLQKLLRTGFRHRMYEALAQYRGCSENEAEQLLNAIVQHGLPAIIDWRGELHKSTATATLKQRLHHAIQKHLSALQPDVLRELEQSLGHVQDAIIQCGIPFPLLRLLQEYPSSPYRIALGRRVGFGAAAKLRRKSYWFKRRKSVSKDPIVPPIPEAKVDAFVAEVAKRLDLDEKQTRSRLRHLITSGGIGMLEKTRWNNALDSRLRNYLHFIKLGHLNGSVDWTRLYEQLNVYAELLGQPAISQQLARALFNALAKPRRWNGGAGEATARTRQRATLTITGVPLLHETWSIFSVVIDLALLDISYRPLSKQSFVTLVVDNAAGLPMGAWLSPEAPTEAEVGLALYQAIWQPGEVIWPIHGIPKALVIDHALFGESLVNIQRSATWLLSTVKLKQYPPQRKDRYEFVTTLRKEGGADLRTKAGTSALQIQQAQTLLLEWLRDHCFPNHRAAPIPLVCRQHGFTTVAHDCPAAGWLLPRAGVIDVDNKGRVQGVDESIPQFASLSGQQLVYRAFPYHYPGIEAGSFIEYPSATDTRIHYLKQ